MYDYRLLHVFIVLLVFVLPQICSSDFSYNGSLSYEKGFGTCLLNCQWMSYIFFLYIYVRISRIMCDFVLRRVILDCLIVNVSYVCFTLYLLLSLLEQMAVCGFSYKRIWHCFFKLWLNVSFFITLSIILFVICITFLCNDGSDMTAEKYMKRVVCCIVYRTYIMLDFLWVYGCRFCCQVVFLF